MRADADARRVVIAAVECACDPAFNLDGVSTSTHFATPFIVVNGPTRTRISLNSTFGALARAFARTRRSDERSVS